MLLPHQRTLVKEFSALVRGLAKAANAHVDAGLDKSQETAADQRTMLASLRMNRLVALVRLGQLGRHGEAWKPPIPMAVSAKDLQLGIMPGGEVGSTL